MIDSDRCPVSNRCPFLKSASTDVIISNHFPNSQIYCRFIAVKSTYFSERRSVVT